MAADELSLRIQRIYAAIGACREFDLGRLRPTVISTKRFHAVFQDFSGGQSEAELANAAFSLIQNIASLKDHLKAWARRSGKDSSKVDRAFTESLPLQIVQDLFDREKHTGDRRDGVYSGRSPRLSSIHREMRLTTQPRKGSSVTLTMEADGTRRTFGDGMACAVITADVSDKYGKRMGDLFEIELQAVQAWEKLLVEYSAWFQHLVFGSTRVVYPGVLGWTSCAPRLLLPTLSRTAAFRRPSPDGILFHHTDPEDTRYAGPSQRRKPGRATEARDKRRAGHPARVWVPRVLPSGRLRRHGVARVPVTPMVRLA
jgi:hypothetical protein